jgi:hypothetical protein
LLAEVVARVEERPLEAFLQERLLDRLGIRLSPSASDPPPALSYRRDGGWLEPDPLPEPSGFDGVTGLRLSALDLYRWTVSFHADPGLRPATLERGSRPVRLAGATAGLDQLGWTAAEDGRRHRFGRRGGLTSFAYRDGKRDLALVFVSNTAMPVGARPRLARALVRVLEGGSREPIVVPERAPLDAVALETLPGRYRLPPREGELELLRGDTGLVARLGGASYAVESAGEGRLRITGLDAWLAFSSPEGGRFGKLHWTSVFETTVGERVAAPAEEVP